MKSVILIKLGGSIITDKKIPYKVRGKAILELAKQLKSKKIKIILAHGSGSFGHTSAAKFGGNKGYKNKWGIAKVARDAMEINNIVLNALIKQKIPAVSLRPMSMIITKNGKLADKFFEPIYQVVEQGLMPVVYGDVILDKKWKTTIYSGEKTLNLIAEYFIKKGYKIGSIIEVGNTDGLYDNFRKTIPKITSKNWVGLKEFIFDPKVKDVTGGMEQKIEEALLIAKKGIKTLLINGNRKNELSKVLLNKKVRGTIIE